MMHAVMSVVEQLKTRAARKAQRLLALLLGFSLLALLAAAFATLQTTAVAARQREAANQSLGQALVQSQRLPKAAAQAWAGVPLAFAEVAESSLALARAVRGLKEAAVSLRLDAGARVPLDQVAARVLQAEAYAGTITGQQKILTQIAPVLRQINQQSADLLALAETVASLQLQQKAPAAEVLAGSQLMLLTQRMAKSANEFWRADGVSSDAVLLLGQDLNTFRAIAQGLLDGSPQRHWGAAREASLRAQLEALLKGYESMRTPAELIAGHVPGVLSAREALQGLMTGSEPLRRDLEALQARLATPADAGGLRILSGVALLVLLLTGALVYVQLQPDRPRPASFAEVQRLEAARQAQTGQAVNAAMQAAARGRSMNEWQATVGRLVLAAAEAEQAATALLAASSDQLHEMRETSRAVAAMANRVSQMAVQTQESVTVAGQSRQGLEAGLAAVQQARDGLNAACEQAGDVSSRIGWLGEGLREMGELSGQLGGLNQQTKLLALNVVIRATSVGAVGPGFSALLEELQRLAGRSAKVTAQMAARGQKIQAEAQATGIVLARTTRQLTAGAESTAEVATVLEESGQQARHLTELIEQTARAAAGEAGLVHGVVDILGPVYAATEQAGVSTRAIALQLRELARLAEELRQSGVRVGQAS